MDLVLKKWHHTIYRLRSLVLLSLWVGWFGFNAGSALAANGLAANAFVATHVATAAGALSWIAIERIYSGRPTVLGGASGAVAGLVAITPAAGFVGPISAIIIGLGGGDVLLFWSHVER